MGNAFFLGNILEYALAVRVPDHDARGRDNKRIARFAQMDVVNVVFHQAVNGIGHAHTANDLAAVVHYGIGNAYNGLARDRTL